jgi:hypothetical protein
MSKNPFETETEIVLSDNPFDDPFNFTPFPFNFTFEPNELKIEDTLIDLNKIYLASKDVQSQGRAVACKYSKYAIQNNVIPIYMTNNSKNALCDIKKSFKKEGLNIFDFENNIIETPCIIPIMGNITQLEKLKQIMEENKNKYYFVCILDEADDLVSDNSKRSNFIREYLKQNINGFLLITATRQIFECSKKFFDIKKCNIISMKSPKDHINFKSKYFKIEKDNYRFSHNFDESDQKMLDKYIKKFNPYTMKNGREYIGGLIVIYKKNKQQKQMGDYLSMKYMNSWIIGLYNDKSTIIHNKINIKEGKFNGLSDMLNYVHNNWNTNDKYVFVIGHDMIARAVSCRAEDDNWKNKDYNELFLITNQIYNPVALCKNHSTIQQGAKRLQGIFNRIYEIDNNFQQVLIITDEIYESLESFDDYNNKTQIIVNDKSINEEESIVNIIPPIKSDDKFTKLFPFSGKNKFGYRYRDNLAFLSNESYDLYDLYNDKNNGNTNGKENLLKKWKKERNTDGIAIYVRAIKPDDLEQIHSEEKLLNEISKINKITDKQAFIHNCCSKNKTSGNWGGLILEKVDGGYKYTEEFKTAWKKVFVEKE